MLNGKEIEHWTGADTCFDRANATGEVKVSIISNDDTITKTIASLLLGIVRLYLALKGYYLFLA